MDYKENVLNQLNDIQKEQTRICVKTTRSAVFSIVGTVWSILIGKTNIAILEKISHVEFLMIIIAIACIFLGIDAWRHYSVANEARKLHHVLVIEDEDTLRVEMKMNKKSDWSFKMFKYQLLIGGIMTIALIAYSVIGFGGFIVL